ncbi:biotin transporter BioY [Corynebacterium sp. P3-F1]|uniref:biotin transporter BioY n=1 Tax=Corynebacterium sp. P3-F1 TaxID=3059080 RepID=UPI00265CCFA5|nr:biotin transporter BioY [Corynebacterium sp. P3-F1]WKK61710.1 biotin transporter BioY [Corynebacterium sp. P3-F1]
MTTTHTPGARGTSVATDIAYIAVFAALISVLGFVAIPVGSAGVPIVLQNAATILAGLVLGGRRGFLATGLFLLISVAFPVLAGGRTLIQAFSGPTIGYLLGYLLGAGAAGYITYRAPRNNKAALIGMLILGSIVAVFLQYFFGTLGLMWRADMHVGPAIAAQLPFILPDMGKLAVMVAIAFAVHSAFPQLRRTQ